MKPLANIVDDSRWVNRQALRARLRRPIKVHRTLISRVLDLSNVLAGPFCAYQLALMGGAAGSWKILNSGRGCRMNPGSVPGGFTATAALFFPRRMPPLARRCSAPLESWLKGSPNRLFCIAHNACQNGFVYQIAGAMKCDGWLTQKQFQQSEEISMAQWKQVVAGLLLGLGMTPAALALDSVKFMIPAAPAGGWDGTTRNFAAAMIKSGAIKNAQFENKGGAGGTIGLAQFVNTSKGDGSAIMTGGMVMVGGIILNKSAVTLSAVTPLARLTGEYGVVVVPANSPIKTTKDLLAKLKADPGSVSWGGGSAGGADHILVGLLAQAGGADASKLNYVPFAGGGEALASILGGHTTASVSGFGEFAQQIKAGKLRALGISSDKRLTGVDIPTFKEQGFDVELANWRGIFAAPGISDAQLKELTAAVDATVKSPAWRETLTKMEWLDLYLVGEPFKKFLDDENKRVGDILAKLNLRK
jgi:putative tricarboxylic transport membrane protein